jgi:hypothetical protein
MLRRPSSHDVEERQLNGRAEKQHCFRNFNLASVAGRLDAQENKFHREEFCRAEALMINKTICSSIHGREDK